MAPPRVPYSGVSQLALVARASTFALSVLYGNMKLEYLKIHTSTLACRECVHSGHANCGTKRIFLQVSSPIKFKVAKILLSSMVEIALVDTLLLIGRSFACHPMSAVKNTHRRCSSVGIRILASVSWHFVSEGRKKLEFLEKEELIKVRNLYLKQKYTVKRFTFKFFSYSCLEREFIHMFLSHVFVLCFNYLQ
ncbi:hypothetical protein V2J09_013125 [Rumex salicifolius]